MNVRFAFVALFGIALSCVNIAVANTGDPLDVNKDGLIDETDADIVVLHINTFGNGTDSVEDALDEFGTWDDEELRDDVLSEGPEEVLYILSLYFPTSGDTARVNYVVTWERKDVTGDGFIVPGDVLAIINYLNSH